jgi:hypothetical protein
LINSLTADVVKCKDVMSGKIFWTRGYILESKDISFKRVKVEESTNKRQDKSGV